MFTFYMTRIWAFFLHFNRPRQLSVGPCSSGQTLARNWWKLWWSVGEFGPWVAVAHFFLHTRRPVGVAGCAPSFYQGAVATQPSASWSGKSSRPTREPLALLRWKWGTTRIQVRSSCAMLCHAFRKWRLLCEAPNETRSGNPTGHFRKALVTTSLSLVFAYI